MQLHQIRPITKQKKKKRVGRGGKRGTYSGRGIKGQKARAGRKLRPDLRDVIKKIPKLRGYRTKNFKAYYVEVGLGDIEKNFNSGETVSPKTLVQKGIADKKSNKIPKIKILNSGDISKKVKIKNCGVSKLAEEKIKKAGGSIIVQTDSDEPEPKRKVSK